MRIAKVLEYARQWKSTAKEVAGHSLLFAQFLSLLHLTDAYIFSPTLAHGPSMLPTLNLTGDVLLVEKLSPLLGKVAPGDVVLVRSPMNPRRTIVKRIVGMEGDRVTFLVDPGHSDRSQSLVGCSISIVELIFLALIMACPISGFASEGVACLWEEKVLVNKYLPDKGHLQCITIYSLRPIKLDLFSFFVPKGHVWIQGDNVYASRDSRSLGSIPYGLVLGRVFYRVWPPQDFGPLRQ